MKIALTIIIILIGIFILFQIYLTMSTNKTEIQAYKVMKVEDIFEIRYYPSTIMAKISSQAKSFRELGSSGFSKLAKYIFGGNSENKQIAMTSPVHMDIGDSISTMAFVMPTTYTKDDLPKPNNSEIIIETSPPEYVAAIKFSGFANATNIQVNKNILENALKEKGIAYEGHFRYLGYNPPYQLFGRRNEVIVSVKGEGNQM